MMQKALNPHLPVLFGYHASNVANSHVPLSLCQHWQASGRQVRLTVPSADDKLDFDWLQPAMGKLKRTIVYRSGARAYPRNAAEELCFKSERDSPVVYLWAGLSLEIFKKFKQRGTRIVIERINCHQATARRILQTACADWGIESESGISEESIAVEKDKLSMADAVFCPSPMVKQSMLDNGVAAEKLLSSSYGWAPERFPALEAPRTAGKRPMFLFVGTLCLRKGIPLLLEAWRRADIDGDLILCGQITPEIEKHFGRLSELKNVQHIPFTPDVGQYFRQADGFVFPSLEEGGPLVTYEAMAHGAVPLVTAMGAGAVAENGINALLLPDNCIDSWAAAICRLAETPSLREQYGEQARQRARQFTWEKVAARRARLLADKFPQLWSH